MELHIRKGGQKALHFVPVCCTRAVHGKEFQALGALLRRSSQETVTRQVMHRGHTHHERGCMTKRSVCWRARDVTGSREVSINF